jgi:hypothetical protein
MRQLFLLAAFLGLLASKTASAQIAWDPSALSVPPTHPRLLYTAAADLARARTWYAAHPLASTPDAVRRAYKGLMLGSPAGDTLCRQAVDLVLTDPEYQLEAGYENGVASDRARWIGEHVILVYDWCWGSFTGTERQTLRTRWNRYLEVLNAKSWGGPGMEFNNYYLGYMRNDVLWGLATWGENTVAGVDRAREFLLHGYRDRYLNGFSVAYQASAIGGVTPEGTAYGRALLDYFLVPGLTLRNMGEDAFARNGFAREAPLYAAYSLTPQITQGTPFGNCLLRYWLQFPFNDDERFAECGFEGVRQEDFSNAMQTFAHLRPSTVLGQIASQFLTTVGGQPSPWMQAFFAGSVPPQPFSVLPADYIASGSRTFYTRTAWNAPSRSSLVLSLGSMSRVGHNHFDAGSFQWWRGGEWASRESTGYAYSGESVLGYRGNGTADVYEAIAHNGVLFEGQGAIEGAGGPDGPSVLLGLRSDADFSWAAVDLTPAFRDRAQPDPCRYDWPYAERAIREFVFLRELETLLILDRLTGSRDSHRYADGEVECFTGFPNNGQPLREASAVERAVIVHGMSAFQASAGAWTSAAGAERLTVRSLLPAGASVTARNERTGPGGASIGNFRLEIVASGAATLEFLSALSAYGGAEAAPAVALTETTSEHQIAVTRGAHSATVKWAKGAVPGALEVTVGARTVLVDPVVQVMRIEDSGPVWEVEDDPACVPAADPAFYFTMAPCRAYDSRTAGAPLPAGLRAELDLRAGCPAIPPTAIAVAANATVVQPTSFGSLSFLPGGCSRSANTNTVSFAPGQTRASNAVLALAIDGDGTVAAIPNLSAGSSAHVVIDVSGYFDADVP